MAGCVGWSNALALAHCATVTAQCYCNCTACRYVDRLIRLPTSDFRLLIFKIELCISPRIFDDIIDSVLHEIILASRRCTGWRGHAQRARARGGLLELACLQQQQQRCPCWFKHTRCTVSPASCKMRPDQSPAKGKFAPLASCDADDSDSDNEALLHAAATAVGGGGGQNAHRGASPVASTTGGYVLQFFALPSQVFVILLLEFLNSYRNFGLRFVQYQYINNEFSMGDIETGSLLGIKSTMDIVFGIIGSLATDAFGVRKTAIVALLMSVVGRGIFTFARSSWWLWLASMTFSPFGEAMLGTGIYTVALKKMTPPKLRPLAFAVQYASFNFSGALCDVVIDYLRMQDDREVFGMRFSGLRTFIFTTVRAVTPLSQPSPHTLCVR
eukprot:COSAG05_NODE_65_length_22456_cov_17.448540_12_plen_385_part_00